MELSGLGSRITHKSKDREKGMPTIVYVLTNPAMPGFVKIGMTDGSDVQARMNSLYSTGVPFPFECAIAWEIEGRAAGEIETALHTAFGPNRVNPSREFFEIDPEQVQVLLRIMPGGDVTPRTTAAVGEARDDDQDAAFEYKVRRTRTDELQFLESLDGPGRGFYESVLALGRPDGMVISWGGKGFSLNVLSNGKRIGICWGFPPWANNQSLYTGFAGIKEQTRISPDVLSTLRSDALATGLFAPAGRGDELRCATDSHLDEQQLTSVVDWLTGVTATIREPEVANPLAPIHRTEWWGHRRGTLQGWRLDRQADVGWMAPAVGLLSVRGVAHEVAEGSKELSLADSCGASWRDSRQTGG